MLGCSGISVYKPHLDVALRDRLMAIDDTELQLHASMLTLSVIDDDVAMSDYPEHPAVDFTMRDPTQFDTDLATALAATSGTWYEENFVRGGWLTYAEVE